MAHPVGDESNDLFSQLADWNLILRDTSIGQVSPAQPISHPHNTSDEPCERPLKGRQMYGARANGEAKKA